MTTTAIEVNDCELRVARDGRVVATSPGYAAYHDGKVLVGAAALAYAQAHPRAAESRFWRDLGTLPLASFGRRVRHHADLAFLHLCELRDLAGGVPEAILLVPGSLQHEQLGLLLGLAEAARIRVRGVVDSAVAAGANALGPGSFALLDLQQHQAQITRLDVAERVVRHDVAVVPGAGALRMQQACVRMVAEAFVAQCRFDPLHHAASEQLLYEQLPGWLSRLDGVPEITARIEYRGTRFEARLSQLALRQAVQPTLHAILDHVAPGITAVASHRVASLPGFRAAHADIPTLPPTAAFESLGRVETGPAGGGLRLVLDLPAAAHPTVLQPRPALAGGESATHLLARHTAHPLRPAPLYLSPRGACSPSADPEASCSVQLRGGKSEVTALVPERVLLNGRVLAGSAPLAAGDQLSFVGAPALFVAITVLPTDDD